MTSIGKFKSTQPHDPLSEILGSIRTINFSGKLAVVRDRASSNPSAPTHRIYLVDSEGERFEVGAAWSQSIKRGAREGEEFLSANIDDPSFERPLSFALFRDDESTWEATWRRRANAN